MTPDLQRAVLRAVATDRREPDGARLEVIASRPVGGGSIHRAQLLELADGRRLFVKSGPASRAARSLETEARGLAALARVGVLRVPARPVFGRTTPGGHEGDGPDGGVAFLAMEAIETRPLSGGGGDDERRRFFARFGHALARLHRVSAETERPGRFGFHEDNVIGATPQPNPWTDDGVAFVRQHRIGHQLELARRNGHIREDGDGDQLRTLGERLLERIDEILAPVADEPGCLLHGDLWSGNFLVAARSPGRPTAEGGAAGDADPEPVLIDPAVHYGHREADLAMSRLFGGFDPAFYDAYAETWPLAPDSARRIDLFQLYHLLNHLNLFGSGYRGRCLEILRRLTRPARPNGAPTPTAGRVG